MLFLQKIKIENFLSHEKTEIEFESEQKLLLDGKSGHGKSAIVDGIVWCLYGRGRVDNRSLIKHGSKSAKIILILEDDKINKTYKIERSVDDTGKNTLKISEKTKANTYLPIKVSGLKMLQEHLEKEILHSSYLLFINSIVYPQDNIENFVKQTAAKRKEIILEIANAGAYDVYYEKAKDELNNQMALVGRNEAIITTLKESVDRDKLAMEPIVALRGERGKLEVEMELSSKKLVKLQSEEALVDSMKQQLSSKMMELMQLEGEYATNQSKVSDANHKLIKLDNSGIKKSEEEIKDLEQWKKDLVSLRLGEEKVSTWNIEMMKLVRLAPVDLGYERFINDINKQIIDVMGRKVLMCPELNKECPHFAKERDTRASELSKLLEEKQTEYNDFKTRAEEHGKQVAALGDCPESKKEEIRKLELIVSEKENTKLLLEKVKAEKIFLEQSLETAIVDGQENIKKIEGKMADCRKVIEELKELVDNTPSRNIEIISLKNEIGAMQSKHSGIIQSLAVAENAERRVAEDSIKLSKLQEEISGSLEKIESLKLLKEAFGQNGIKAIVIDYLIPRLEDRINDVLSKLSDFRVHLNTQKSGVKEDVILEGLFISIFNENGVEFDYDNYSGSEKLRITYAIFEGLANLQNIGFRILDELVQGMDAETEARFVEIMLKLKEDVAQIICVSHLQSIKDLFENKIEIGKINGNSQII